MQKSDWVRTAMRSGVAASAFIGVLFLSRQRKPQLTQMPVNLRLERC